VTAKTEGSAVPRVTAGAEHIFRRGIVARDIAELWDALLLRDSLTGSLGSRIRDDDLAATVSAPADLNCAMVVARTIVDHFAPRA
jgi:hypothetical protein